MKKVSEAARELLSSLPSHKVSVVAVSKAARLPRASLLLQFPDGVPEILEMLFTEEEAAFSEPEEQLSEKRCPQTGLNRAMLGVEVLLARAEASGYLYANLLSEVLQSEGPRRKEFRAAFVFLGMGFLRRLHQNDDTFLLTPRNLALAETLARAMFHLAATSPVVEDWPVQPEKTAIARILLEGVASKIESSKSPTSETAA